MIMVKPHPVVKRARQNNILLKFTLCLIDSFLSSIAPCQVASASVSRSFLFYLIHHVTYVVPGLRSLTHPFSHPWGDLCQTDTVTQNPLSY